MAPPVPLICPHVWHNCFLSSCDGVYIFPSLYFFSGVCCTLGGERRLLQPRLVVTSVTRPPAHHSPLHLHDGRGFSFCWQHVCISLLFWCHGCKASDCFILFAFSFSHPKKDCLTIQGTIMTFSICRTNRFGPMFIYTFKNKNSMDCCSILKCQTVRLPLLFQSFISQFKRQC